MRILLCCAAVILSLLLFLSCTQAQDAEGQAFGRNVADMRFVKIPGLPTCVLNSVQNGDPKKGPSIVLVKMPAGCSMPWHWHTPNENMMMVSGVAYVEMKGAKPTALRAGGYALLPSHHLHQFRCTTPCTFYIYSDTAFDLHYVDATGKEITPDDALRAVGETAVH